MLNMDEIKGKARQVVGAIKENLGWLTNDHKAEDEGKNERIDRACDLHRTGDVGLDLRRVAGSAAGALV
jgi:hypothetical protein